jgi:hypothetical protein
LGFGALNYSWWAVINERGPYLYLQRVPQKLETALADTYLQTLRAHEIDYLSAERTRSGDWQFPTEYEVETSGGTLSW